MTLLAVATRLRHGRPSSPEVIADVLRSLILRGDFESGQPLRQDLIAGWFGVSHIPVREAFRQLRAEGLVEIRDKRGATVAPLQADEAEEIFEIRYTLEVKAVRLAMPHWTDATFGSLDEVLADAESCDSIDVWSDLNRKFHDGLYRPCSRPRLLELIGGLNAKVERYIRLLISRSDYRLQAQREHRAILASARIRNLSALSALIEQHAVETGIQLRHFLVSHNKIEMKRRVRR
jgi:DNA-binding GntR family transcriptional regulator